MAVEDAYGAEQWREGAEGSGDEVALPHRAHHALDVQHGRRVRVPHRGGHGRQGLRRPEVDRLPRLRGDAQGGARRGRERHPDVQYEPVLIDATYAGLITGAPDVPLVIPALNRDGDCLSDLVLPMFGSIAGAESVLLAFDEDLEVDVAMAEAPHGTAPALLGKDIANPMAMLLACGAVLHYAAEQGHDGAEQASRAIYESVLEATAAGVRTPDLGGHAGTTEFTADVVGRVQTKLEVWSSLGLALASSRALRPTGSPASARASSFRCSMRRRR